MSHLINGQAVNAVFISHPVATSRSALYASLEPTDNHHHESISPADSRASSLRGTPSSLSSVDAFGPIDCRVEKGLSGFHGGLLNATCVRSVNLAHRLRSFLALSVFQVCFLVFFCTVSSIWDHVNPRHQSTCSSALSTRRIARASRSSRARDRFAKTRS